MGREIVYCDVCGDRILETDFEKSSAFTAENKNYCPNCADKAPVRPPPPPAPSPSAKSSGFHTALQQDTPRRLTRPGSSGKTSGLLPSVRAEVPGKKATTRKHDPMTRKSQTGRVPQTDTRAAQRPRAATPPILMIAAGVFAALILLIIIIVVVSRGRSRRQAEAPRPAAVAVVRSGGTRTAG